jgi:DNA-binding NarL/FixJ family response regulator
VDDHEVILNGLRDFVDKQEDMVVVFEARSAEGALEAMQAERPDIAILDVRLPDMGGVELCREVRSRYPDVKCLMFSSFPNESAMLEAVVAGASGFLLKDVELREFVMAVREVARGTSIIDPVITQRALERLQHPRKDGLELLTPQERKILALMAEGLSNRDIAEQLHLAEQTVKNYVSSILTKLGVQRRTQATLFVTDPDTPNE